MRNTLSTIAALAIALLCTPALAMDPACQQLMNAEKNMAGVPFHVYLTTQRSYENSTLAHAGAQLGLGGAKKSEEISTGKDVYVLHDGKWIDMQTNFMEMSDPNDPDVKKAHEAARCHALPDTTVNGQPASGFEEINTSNGTDSKIWFSKINHLPLKSEMVTDAGPMKTSSSGTYDYNNVHAPSGAMTMQQMIAARHH